MCMYFLTTGRPCLSHDSCLMLSGIHCRGSKRFQKPLSSVPIPSAVFPMSSSNPRLPGATRPMRPMVHPNRSKWVVFRPGDEEIFEADSLGRKFHEEPKTRHLRNHNGTGRDGTRDSPILDVFCLVCPRLER